ncbi:MAG: hypothetical protein VX466_01145 [Myxococcota bacterium]|nr:hypothetical protein [Myxococcota bacterium]
MPTQPSAPARSEPGLTALRAFGQGTLDRLYAFRVIYVAIFVFILLYVFSVRGAESLLQNHFESIVRDSLRITNLSLPVKMQIQSRIDQRVVQSRWVRWGGVQATVIVLAGDGLTWIYVGGRSVQPPASLDPAEIAREAARLLPAQEEVIVAVPHNALLANAILVFYATLLLSGLFFYNLALGRRESRRLEEATSERDLTVLRAESIEQELETVRRRMLEVEPAEREQTEEIRALEQERETLQTKLAGLAQREEDLRLKAARAVELDQERQALEDLLAEAAGDLSTKDEEIRNLETSLKRAGPASTPASGRNREADILARRFETLYKTLEIDPRALTDLVALRDETMKLKAEDSLKRLADDTGNVTVRRKVGGLPPGQAIFELGFAGKGRIYYTKGSQRRFRVLTIGAKNTQKNDLDYLRKLSF